MSSNTLFVEKLGKQVQIVFDSKSLRIQSDATAIVPRQKKSKKSRSCVCLPTLETNDDPSSSPASSSLPIPHRNILHANYNARTNMVQLNTLVADKPSDPESTTQLFKFMYTVRDNEQEKATEFCQNIMTSVYQDLIPEKRVLVLINPFGGQAKAKSIFEEKVKPVLEAAKCKLDIQYTEHRYHALEIAKGLDIGSYDTIVTVSGDGLIHEVINGFLQRPDAREALQKVALGLIPAGTSNSLSISMSGEKLGFDPIHNALQIIKGRPLALDLCSVTYEDSRYFSFLSQSFGIAAYADLGTEHMRWMGDNRTVVGLMQEIFSKSTYQMEASLLIAESDKEKIKQNYKSGLKSSEWKSPAVGDGAVLDTIPPLSDPVPENWTTINGDVSIFLASNVPLLNRGMLSHPCVSANDGYIDLMLVRGGKGIGKQLSMFTSVDTGKHLDMDLVEYYKVKAFRLKPIIKPGKSAYVAIDGEHASAKQFQVEVHQALGSVLSLNPTFINTNVH
ncbi:diacylglycerol kinase catalytic domain family protein [Mucor ambiguus]|uniref:Diacylglycerol kinase catalytic domain family protein n=1 Tax=Mucor ambiguus TaxID=91626 RepID=A0A0C9MCL7_9FUNG|nr:diacylglycerol kinase catalytic domain family protein [Mucor ambiguus]